ncbi:MAG: TolC family protein [Deltaproteobacteria bacterium]|nr:TolC family protein [Deltaproteobacteria bacterium]
MTLQEVVRQVLSVHPLTQAARARVQAALGMARQARAYSNPAFTFTNNDFSFERTYGLTQSLEWPFKRTYRIGVAEAEERIAEGERNGVRQEVIAAAREAFLSVLLVQEGNRVAEAFVEATQRLQGSTEKLFQEGDIAEFEVIKARVEALRAETDLEKVRGQLKTARSGLNLLLGRSEDSPLALAGSLLTPPPVPPLAELLPLAEEQNPLLVAQRRVVEREQLNLKLAWASLMPDFSVDVSRGEDLKAGITGPFVGLTFSFPLWDRKEGAIAAARGKVAEAEANVRATQLQVHQTLLTAYRNWEIARGQVEAFARGLVVQAEQAAALAEQGYREGAGDLLGVLDAERSLLTVRRDYAQALFDLQMARVALERAAGTGTDQ